MTYSLEHEVSVYMSSDQIHVINHNRNRLPEIIKSMDTVHGSDVYSAWPKMDDNSRRDLITKAMDLITEQIGKPLFSFGHGESR